MSVGLGNRGGRRAGAEYLTTQNVLARCEHRVSYRQLDYWIRTGVVACLGDSPGSGGRREFTEEQAEAITRVVATLAELDARREEVASGQFFKDALSSINARNNPT